MWCVYFIAVFLWIWPKEEHNFEEDLGMDGKGETTLDRLDCERCHSGCTEKVQSSLTQCLGRLHRQISNSITLVQTLFIFRYILFLIYALLHRLLRDLECSLYSAARNAVISICSSPKMKRQFQSLQWQGESASENPEWHTLGVSFSWAVLPWPLQPEWCKEHKTLCLKTCTAVPGLKIKP